MTLVAVLLGGAAGAITRYLVDDWVRARWAGLFPWGTFAANVAGSFLAGLLAGAVAGGPGAPQWLATLAGPGFCGALTTYSTFGLETVTAGRRYGLLNAAGTLVAGLGAAALGAVLTGPRWPGA